MSEYVTLSILCRIYSAVTRAAITFNGDGVVDEHFVTTVANVLFRLWTPTPCFSHFGRLGLPKTNPVIICGKSRIAQHNSVTTLQNALPCS